MGTVWTGWPGTEPGDGICCPDAIHTGTQETRAQYPKIAQEEKLKGGKRIICVIDCYSYLFSSHQFSRYTSRMLLDKSLNPYMGIVLMADALNMPRFVCDGGFVAVPWLYPKNLFFSCSCICPFTSYLHVAARAIAQVSEVKGERIRTVAFLNHKTEVGLVSPTCPAYVLIVVNKLPLSQQHSAAKNNSPKAPKTIINHNDQIFPSLLLCCSKV